MSHAQRRKIVTTGERANWLDARRITRDRGGLPPHAVLDDFLVRMNKDIWGCEREKFKSRRKELEKLDKAWAREVLVYPRIRGEFNRGQDFECAHVDKKGRRWILPASHIPEEATGRKGIGLFIDPEGVTEEKGRVVVHPRSVVVLRGFLEEYGDGVADEDTRIPVSRAVYSDRRKLFRSEEDGVYPMYRLWKSTVPFHSYTICASMEPCDKNVVAYVEDELQDIIANAGANLQELLKDVGPEKLEGMRRLVQALKTNG